MRQFSLFTAPYYSFFSKALYVDVGRRWGAETFVYLLLVLALLLIPFMFSLSSNWSTFVSDSAPVIQQNLSTIHKFNVDGPTVEKWLRLFGTWGVVLLYPVVVVGSYLYRVLQALFYSVLGLAIARFLRCRLNYGEILRVAIVAITPALVLETICGMADLFFPFSWVLYSCVAIGYLTFGLHASTDGAEAGVAQTISPGL